jgi:valyl-tRNA synthetase
VTRTEAKLANPSFVDKAPAAVVQKERERMAESQAAIDNLRGQRAKIQSL